MKWFVQTSHSTRRGFTLIEAIYLMVFLAIAGVAVGVGLQSVAKGTSVNDEERAVAAEVSSEIETYRGMTFTALSALAGTNTTDTVSIKVAGTTKSYARNIVIQLLDANNPAANASPQSDFISVQVSIKDRTAAIWVAQP